MECQFVLLWKNIIQSNKISAPTKLNDFLVIEILNPDIKIYGAPLPSLNHRKINIPEQSFPTNNLATEQSKWRIKHQPRYSASASAQCVLSPALDEQKRLFLNGAHLASLNLNFAPSIIGPIIYRRKSYARRQERFMDGFGAQTRCGAGKPFSRCAQTRGGSRVIRRYCARAAVTGES